MDTNIKVLILVALVALVAIVAFALVGSGNEEEQGGDSERVTYFGNGGVFDQDETRITAEVTDVMDCVFVNGSKVFNGWNTKSNGSGTWYFPNDQASFGTSLYAMWVDYKVTRGKDFSTGTGETPTVALAVNGKSIYHGYGGYDAPSSSNKVVFTAFDNTYTDVKFISYTNNGTTDTIELSANYDGKHVECTLEIEHSSHTGPLFKEGSQKVESGSFSMEIIGKGDLTVNVSRVVSNIS